MKTRLIVIVVIVVILLAIVVIIVGIPILQRILVMTLADTVLDSRDEEGLPKTVETEGPPTALEAYELIAPVAIQWSSDSYLWRVSSNIQNLTDRPTKGPGVGIDGRIREHGVWVFQFVSDAKGRQLAVTVTAYGDLTTKSMALVETVSSYPVLEPGWCDSSKAMAIAEGEAGETFRSDRGLMLDIQFDLRDHTHQSSQQLWWIHYMAASPDGGRLHIYIDPISGDVVDVITQ